MEKGQKKINFRGLNEMADFDLIPRGLFLCRVLSWVFLSCQVFSRQLLFLSASRSSSSGDESAINKRIGGKPTKSGTFLASARQPIGADPSAFWESYAGVSVRQARGPNVLALSSCQWDPSVQSTDQAHMWHLKKKGS